MRKPHNSKPKEIALYDKWFIIAAVMILAIGLLMVASASIVISDRLYHQPFHYLIRQIIFMALGIGLIVVTIRIDTEFLFKISPWLILLSVILLILVLIPGIGREVNGSRRWINLVLFQLQSSELVKLFFIIYLAGYVVRHNEAVRTQVSGFLKPMIVLAVIAFLLLLQPDFGAAAVIAATALGVLFLAGVKPSQFLILMILVLAALAVLAVSSPYRMQRLTSFLNPWANQYGSGYQLTQSLIAFGRGGIFGTGLGESVQKLFYLPEAHTDFLFAVLAEELGLIAVLTVIGLFMLLVSRGLCIARWAIRDNRLFAGYLCYGLSLWIGLQAIINIGVNSGLLPTKGLTLPLMSYGGSSMLVNCIVLGILLRVDHENRMGEYGLARTRY